jgi:hypothetical protein
MEAASVQNPLEQNQQQYYMVDIGITPQLMTEFVSISQREGLPVLMDPTRMVLP